MTKGGRMQLKGKGKTEKNICGNCRYHNAYDYPDKIFCFAKFQNLENPVVSIFDCCDEWQEKTQECFCLEEARKKNLKKKRD